MEVVTTSTLALGSRELTKREAIVSRLAAIEDVAGMTMLASDKTGTLTLNKMVIQEHTPVFQAGLDQVRPILADNPPPPQCARTRTCIRAHTHTHTHTHTPTRMATVIGIVEPKGHFSLCLSNNVSLTLCLE